MDGETNKPKDALPLKEGQPSGQEVSPSAITPESYTREQLDVLIAERHGTLDKRISSLEKELKETKATVATKESELANVVEERVTLEKRIEELASNDPELNNLEKRAKELRELERKLKADRQTLEADKQTNAEKVKLAEDTLREISIWEIATEFDSGDAVKLKDLCDIFQASSEEQIRRVADTLWKKKLVEPSPSVKPYSGMTSGGTEDLSNLSPREKIDKGLEKLKKK